MKKLIYIIVISLLIPSGGIYGLQVAEDEVKKAKRVKFINYKGKYSKVDSVESVRLIGSKLSQGIDKADNNYFNFYGKYSIIHEESGEEKDKLSADIISIDKKARVKNISYVRYIISEYLIKRYNYSKKEGDSLALFITYYNAIYRGNIKYIGSMYKKSVLSHMTKSNAGIAREYYNWPGKSKILIPLSEKQSVDPFAVSDDMVREEVRKDDSNIDERKSVTKLKEKDVDQDKKALDQLKEDVSKEKVELDKSKIDVDKKKQDGTETELIKKEEKEIEKKEQDIKEKEELIKKKEQEIIKKEDEIKKDKEAIKEDEIKQEAKKDPIKLSKKLEARSKELDKREESLRSKQLDKNIFANMLFYLKIKQYLKDGHYDNEMYMIDASSGKVILKSSVTNICGNRYDIFEKGIVVILHKGGHNTLHHLAILDRQTLELIISSNTNIFWRSFVEIRDGFIYTIMVDTGGYRLAKHDSELKLVSKSDVFIAENTFITFFKDLIYINAKDSKNIIILKKDNLKKFAEVDITN